MTEEESGKIESVSSYRSPNRRTWSEDGPVRNCTLRPSAPVLAAPSAAGNASTEVTASSGKKKGKTANARRSWRVYVAAVEMVVFCIIGLFYRALQFSDCIPARINWYQVEKFNRRKIKDVTRRNKLPRARAQNLFIREIRLQACELFERLVFPLVAYTASKSSMFSVKSQTLGSNLRQFRINK